MERVTLYTPEHSYMGWVKADWKSSGRELGSWMQDSPEVCFPNYDKYRGKIYNCILELKSELNAKG